MSDLFEAAGLGRETATPLAERLRPKRLEDVVGQDHLLGPDGPIRRLLSHGVLPSLILWGPAGTGKTTIARLLAKAVRYEFQQISAVFSGVADLRKVFEQARMRRIAGQATLLFVDEIHRFNKAQQDGFLPFVEEGIVTLVGATTENPSFELNSALLSRCQVFVLNPLNEDALAGLVLRAEALQSATLPLDAEARRTLIAMADGDGRHLLTLVESLFGLRLDIILTADQLLQILQRRRPRYDKSGEGHYGLISALHKAVRGSDPDAALYWLARMLEAGEDPNFLARRLIRMASEDIGAADPTALPLAIAAAESYARLGSPEGELALAQLTIHLACAPKSNAVYTAYKSARALAKTTGSLQPPAHILNAPTGLMRSLGYGAGYHYDHDAPGGVSGQNYWPEGLAVQSLYMPKAMGAEADVKVRLEAWSAIRAAAQKG